MKKGEKIYTLTIKYNDKTGECISMCETIDRIHPELEDIEFCFGDDFFTLSEFIDDCWLDVTDSPLIGVA
jgi:hypothetical protein